MKIDKFYYERVGCKVNIEQLNTQLREEFLKRKDYSSLEKYVMSEMLSPIEDYPNAVNIICDNLDLLENLNLLYVATYLNSEYCLGHNDLLDKLKSRLNAVDDKNKSIIYFLEAYDIICNDKNWKKNKRCVGNLSKSIELSSDFSFSKNRFYMAQCVKRSLAKDYAIQALKNVRIRYDKESLHGLGEDYWLSSQNFIDEFILGVSISEVLYESKKDTLINLGIL